MSTVRVRFFASYAELAGCETTAVELSLPATVRDVVRRVREQLPGTRALPERPLAAVNLRHVKLDAPVGDGDEVALLPPLAGG
ncbi:MAG TPA: MoaD/ThiS family protein [Gemmatimonadales bacterium]|jgi:molybdopterin converting factor small subunit|nr:MoaD/ThiS family protein [Gemmatimonadales bacterium]